MRVDAAQHLDEARVCRGDVRGQIVGEDGTEPVEALEAAGDRDAEGREAVEADVLAAVRTAQRKQRHALRSLDVRQLVDLPVEVSEHLEPVEDVAAAVPTRRAGMAPDRQDDVAPGDGQLESELLPRRTGADDEDRPVGKQVGTAVVGGVQGGDLRRRREGHIRGRGVAGREHDTAGDPGAVRRLDAEGRAPPHDPQTSTPSTTGASNDRAYASRCAITSVRDTKPSGSFAARTPGRRFIQFGESSVSESQRSCQRCPTGRARAGRARARRETDGG